MSDENHKEKTAGKKIPFLVNVNKDETENFMNDILEGASKLNHKQKSPGKILFLKSFLLGFIVFCVCLFFLYTSYYFVDHALLHRQESCLPLP